MILRFLYPPKCIICRRLLEPRQTDICPDCRAKLVQNISSKRTSQFIAQRLSIWYYNEDVRRSVHRFKFGKAQGYADAYARELAQILLQSEIADDFECITWVPISFKRFMQRGYNQSAILAKALGKEVGCPVLPLLKKIRHTPAQSTLRSAAERRANILGAYQAKNLPTIAGRKILLVDDVYTTGATANECAKILHFAGAKTVHFASIAITKFD